MMGTALGIGSSQLGQPNPWGFSPYGGQWISSQPFSQQPQSYSQAPQLASFAGYGGGNHPFGVQPAQYAQPLQQIQQQHQQHQHTLQHQQLHQLQQLLQLVPQQLHQLQQLVQLLPQQLQQIQQLVQFVPQQIQQLQQQLLAQQTSYGAQQTPYGAAIPAQAGLTMSQPFGGPIGWSPAGAPHPFGISSTPGQVM